ncbi:MAG TPA: hypothetical protein VI248_26390 [Kineosporiaceae bacterium]
MLYCQSAPDDHRASAVYALTFARACGHPYPVRTLACLQHGAEHRARSEDPEPTRCERCGESSPLTLARIEDVFEERVVLTISRSALQTSAHSPVTIAYDRAYQAAVERGVLPVTTYRAPVQWSSPTPGRPLLADVLEARVTLAVTQPDQPSYRAG